VVIEHEAGDLTCTVEADTPMVELQAALAGAGQMLALDPPGDERLTVGDVFDRGLFGPRAHGYGRPRDLILGIRARLPGGEDIRGGGKVVKNVAGYDLPKLFTGADGRLGRLLELTLRLHPLPARTCTLVTQTQDATVFEPLAPSCVDYRWAQERLLVRFEGPVADRLAEQALGLAGGELVEQDEQLWDEQRVLQAGLHLHRCLPADCPQRVAELRVAGATAVVGRWARGWLFADLPAPEREPSRLEQRVIARFVA
jgi:glycolate oxidase FAD binding subunit